MKRKKDKKSRIQKNKAVSRLTPQRIRTKDNGKTLLSNTTGDPFQFARIHYDLHDKLAIQKTFSNLKCMDYDSDRNRWVWLYEEESKKIKFSKASYKDVPQNMRPLVIGSFFSHADDHMYLDVNSFERATKAIPFFDKHISREIAELSHMQIVNKLFEFVPGSLPDPNDYFDPFQQNKPDEISPVEKIIKDDSIDRNQKMLLVQQYIKENSKRQLEEVENIPIHFYEEGIESLLDVLRVRNIIMTEHWQGNTKFSFKDVFKNVFAE